MNGRAWTARDISELVSMNSFHNVDDMATYLKRPASSIRTKLRALSLNNQLKKTGRESKAKILLSDELASYYWIGFILADGWITKKGKGTVNEIGVSVSCLDYQHILKFANFCGVAVRSHTRNTNFKNSACMCDVSLSIAEPTTSAIIDKFGLNYRKSYNPPNVKLYEKFTNLQRFSLILGYLDGDGSIIDRQNGANRQIILSVQAHHSWKEFLQFTLDELQNISSVKIRSTVGINSRDHCQISITKISLLREVKRLAISNNIPLLERKWNKVSLID
jgi:hypothetical protein